MVFLNVIAIYNSFLSKPITDSAKPWFHLPFSGLGGWKGVGGGGGLKYVFQSDGVSAV